MLCLVAVLAQPLVYAHANGYSIIGANLGVSHSRASSLKVAHHWLASLGVAASVVPFLVGEYSGGPRVAVAPYTLTRSLATSSRAHPHNANASSRPAQPSSGVPWPRSRAISHSPHWRGPPLPPRPWSAQ
eukprot:3194955-Pleurochrysis_carterae.AAC.1